MQYFRFANWSRLQHYADRNPPWAKIYACILDLENDWYKLTDAQSGQLVRIIALACRRENTMPFSNELIADEIHASGPVDLGIFRDLGMIDVYSTRSQCLQIEHDRINDRQSSKSASKNASNSASRNASGGASKSASKNAVLREQSAEFRDQKGTSGSGSSVSSEGIFGTETEQLSRGAPEPELLPTPAAPAADGGLAERNAEREAAWAAWRADLVERSDDPEAAVLAYVAALEAAVGEFYAQTGGRFTPTRKAKLAAFLGKLIPDVQMMAIEIYVDRSAGLKDERYMAGVARRLSQRSEREREAEITKHRRQMAGAGLLDSLKEGQADGDHSQGQQSEAVTFADDRDGAAVG